MRILFAIATLSLAAFAVGCDAELNNRNYERDRLSEELREARETIDRLQYDLNESSKERRRLTEQHILISRENERLATLHSKSSKRETALAEELSEKRSKLSTLTSAVDQYREKHRQTIRAAAVGTRLASITTTHGDTYRNVTIKEITEGSMKFTHANGFAAVSFEDLPSDIQDRYAYSPTRFINETINGLDPLYLMTPEEVAATGPSPVPPPPQNIQPEIPLVVVRQQLAQLDNYVANLRTNLKRAEAMRDNVDKIDRGSNIKTSQADKRKMTRELDANVMAYRQRLVAAERQVAILKAHLPAEEGEK